MGTRVTITCTGFQEPTPVTIRWNQADGPAVATAKGPDFSVAFDVPANISPDVYYVVALQNSANGQVVGKASDTFQVTGNASGGPAGATAAASAIQDQWSGFKSPGDSLGSALSSITPTGPASSTALTAGLALLTFGIVCSVGGTAVVLVRRTPKQATK